MTEKKYVKSWRSSIQPRKQRKFSANAPLHIRRSIMKCNLSPELRKRYGIRIIVVRKGDTVRVMRGSFKGRKEKVEDVDRRRYVIYLSNIFMEKRDGTKIKRPVRYTAVQIIELDMADKKRIRHPKKVSE
jgi:large subunit ribosomal protein L24